MFHRISIECIITTTLYYFQLHFTDFGVEQHTDCEYDYLEIFNGGLPSSPSIGRYCGTTPPEDIVSQSNQMRIEFHSDESSAGRGFRLEYEFDSLGEWRVVYLDYQYLGLAIWGSVGSGSVG